MSLNEALNEGLISINSESDEDDESIEACRSEIDGSDKESNESSQDHTRASTMENEVESDCSDSAQTNYLQR